MGLGLGAGPDGEVAFAALLREEASSVLPPLGAAPAPWADLQLRAGAGMTHSGMRRGTGPGLQETPGRFGLCCLQRPLEPQTGSAGQWSPELSLHPPLYYRLFTIFMPPPPYGCGSQRRRRQRCKEQAEFGVGAARLCGNSTTCSSQDSHTMKDPSVETIR